ncbi:shikimate kinase [Altererythrobacter sp. CAU 1778]
MSNAQTDLSSDQIRAIVRRIDRPVVLVGMMGVGKSTVGRKLAELMDAPFHDADDEISQAAQLSITEIFERFGEDYFRDGERRVIARLMEDASIGVIATGGGAFIQDETRALILEGAIAVWLDCDLDTLVERVGRRNNRPLLKTGDPREILSSLLEQRNPVYQQAHIRVPCMEGPHEAMAGRILEAIDRWL